MDVSENSGGFSPPKSSHGLIGFSIIISHPFWGSTEVYLS